jgi:uncharacterized membrane protein YphA (DoxX/SURF4 family)
LEVRELGRYQVAAVIAAIVLIAIFTAYIYGFATGVIPPYAPYPPVPSHITWTIIVILLIVVGYAALRRPKKK